MLSIDEAIAHAREVAEDKRADADWKFRHGRLNADDCISCAEEHEQLAEWLEELKMYRESSYGELYSMVYNKAIDDALSVVEWDGYTIDIKERIEQLKRGVEDE